MEGLVDDVEGAEARDRVLYTKPDKKFQRKPKGAQRKGVKDREWVQSKKDRARRQGKETRADSKFTARKRKPKF
jgi:hypothetical protein